MEEAQIVHIPIMSEEICRILAPDRPGQVLFDCTLGEGGHTRAFLSRFPDLHVLGLDADRSIQARARKRLAVYGDRVEFVHAWFDEYFKDALFIRPPDRILMDLGISMFHYKKSGRGFTFTQDEPLDMRLDPGCGLSARDVVNDFDQEALADLVYELGEERYSRRIAAAIVRERKQSSIDTALHLAAVISSAVPPACRHGRIHPATRSFQALRIYVNRELERLKTALRYGLKALAPGGIMGIITFHSLEDRLVKRCFKTLSKSCVCPPEQPCCDCGGMRVLDVLTRKPLRPSDEEVAANPASRSARFRAARRVSEYWREPDV